jgi:hypothetical protein
LLTLHTGPQVLIFLKVGYGAWAEVPAIVSVVMEELRLERYWFSVSVFVVSRNILWLEERSRLTKLM